MYCSVMLGASKMLMLLLHLGFKNVTTSRPHSVFSCNLQCKANLHPLTDYKLCLSRPTVCLQIVHIHHHHQSNPEEEVDFNWSVN